MPKEFEIRRPNPTRIFVLPIVLMAPLTVKLTEFPNGRQSSKRALFPPEAGGLVGEDEYPELLEALEMTIRLSFGIQPLGKEASVNG